MAEAHELVRRYFRELLTAPGNLDVADEIFTPDVTFDNPVTPIHGIEGYKAFARRWYVGFPDRDFQLDDTIVEGDKVGVRFTITGHHRGEFMGAAATGNAIKVVGMNLFKLHKGRIQHVEAHWNPMQLWDPLGVSPPKPGGLP